MSAKSSKKTEIDALPYSSDIIEIADRHSLGSSERLILLLLRSFMNKKKAFCYPSQKNLAKGAKLSERHVRRVISELVGLNIIFITRKKTGRRINEYRFNFPWNVGENMKQVQKDTGDLLSTGHPCPVQQDTHDLYNGTPMTSRKDSTGHPRPFYGINKEKNNQGNNSSSSIKQTDDDEGNPHRSSIRDDQQTDTQIGDESSLADDEGRLPQSYVPPPGAPLMMNYDDFHKYFGIAPIDLLTSNRDFNLQYLIEPFKKNGQSDLNKPFAEYLQTQFDDFYDNMVSRHWKRGEKPEHGFKVLVHRAARAGALYHFGWKPRSKEQVKAEKMEKEHLEAEACEMKRREFEKRKKARLEAEEREKRQKENDAKLMEFISSEPAIQFFIDMEGCKSPEQIRILLKELRDDGIGRTRMELIGHCQNYMMKQSVAQVKSKLEKKLRNEKNTRQLFLNNKLLSESYLTDDMNLIFDNDGEIEAIARKMVKMGAKLDESNFEYCLGKLIAQAG